MARRCVSDARLLLAGAIVMVVGLGVALPATFSVPRRWTTFVVGVGLLALGAALRLARRGG